MNDAPVSIQRDQVDSVIRTMVGLVAPQRRTDVASYHRMIGDLGFHSLAQAELGFALEDLFALDPITPEQAMRIERVRDIEALIAHALDTGVAQWPTEEALRDFAGQYGAEWSDEP